MIRLLSGTNAQLTKVFTKLLYQNEMPRNKLEVIEVGLSAPKRIGKGAPIKHLTFSLLIIALVNTGVIPYLPPVSKAKRMVKLNPRG